MSGSRALLVRVRLTGTSDGHRWVFAPRKRRTTSRSPSLLTDDDNSVPLAQWANLPINVALSSTWPLDSRSKSWRLLPRVSGSIVSSA